MSLDDVYCAECSEYHDPRLHGRPGGSIEDALAKLDPVPEVVVAEAREALPVSAAVMPGEPGDTDQRLCDECGQPIEAGWGFSPLGDPIHPNGSDCYERAWDRPRP